MKISDFNISGKDIPEDVADKICEFHLKPLERVNIVIPCAVSKKSSYRSRKWELDKGRSGNSQHCYYGKGGSDVTTKEIRDKQIELSKGLISYKEYISFAYKDFALKKDRLLKELIENTEYTRFAIYDTFIHCDYAHSIEERWVFDKNWKRLYQI